MLKKHKKINRSLGEAQAWLGRKYKIDLKE
jgi:hypothetical protein